MTEFTITKSKIYSVTLPPGKEIPFIFLKIETAYESVIPEIKSITLKSL